jgi:hypothetical protein
VRLPIALVSLDTPYFSGTVEACVIDNPVCDVILGRVEGCTFGCVEVANAVQTRAQKAREERPFRPLLTAKVPQLDVNAEKLSQLQREDASLQELFDKVGKGKDESSGCVVSFVLRDKLLYRKYYSKVKDEVVWQLVVPETLRESVLVTAHDGLFGGHLGANSTFKRVSAYLFGPVIGSLSKITADLAIFVRKLFRKVEFLLRHCNQSQSLTYHFREFALISLVRSNQCQHGDISMPWSWLM